MSILSNNKVKQFCRIRFLIPICVGIPNIDKVRFSAFVAYTQLR